MMPSLKALVKSGYNHSRSLIGQHTLPNRTAKLWVLMYHRILPADDPRFACEEPGMLVTPETLAMHLDVVKQLFTPVSLQDWLRRAERGESLPAKACAITFDDGWYDNFEYALPVLQQAGVPATLFAVVDKIGTNFRFWPNIIAQLMAERSAVLHRHALFADAASVAQSGFSKERAAAVIAALKQYSEDALFAALKEAGWQASATETPALMNWSQLQTLADSGCFDIGCHTATHRRLNQALAPQLLDDEIIHSYQRLKQRLPAAVNLFCYPNGDYGAAALHRVTETYAAAVTTQSGINRRSTLQRHQLARIALHEDASNSRVRFRARLAGW